MAGKHDSQSYWYLKMPKKCLLSLPAVSHDHSQLKAPARKHLEQPVPALVSAVEIFPITVIVVGLFLHFTSLFLIHLNTYGWERHIRILFSSEITTCLKNEAVFLNDEIYSQTYMVGGHADSSTEDISGFPPDISAPWKGRLAGQPPGVESETSCPSGCPTPSCILLWADNSSARRGACYFGLCQIPLISSWWYVISILIPVIC